MKKAVGLFCFSSVMLAGLAPSVLAEELVPSVGKSDASINLIENNEPTGPVDPTDPGKPIDPTNPVDPGDNGGKETGNKGPLSLDVAPALFNFGEQKMYSTTHTYQGVNAGDVENQYLQVTDNRDAGTHGWVVNVKQESYLKTVDNYVLEGATINVPKGEARNSLNNPSADIDAKLDSYAVDINTADQPVLASKMSNLSGKGTSTSMWKAADVSLTIPAGVAKAGNYTSTVVWTLTAEVTQ